MSLLSRRGPLAVAGASLAAAVALSGAPAVSAATPNASFRLTLLHNNDAESKLVTGNSLANYGGVARFKTVVSRLRAEADAYSDNQIANGLKRKGTILVSSGDNFLAGTNLAASFAKGVPWYDSLAFDALDYDAATLGNHEFDFGTARLAQFIQGTTDVPFLSANLRFNRDPNLAPLATAGRIKASTIIEVGGDRVGVIGLTPPNLKQIASPGPRITILQNVAAFAQREANALRAAGVNKVILSSHLQGLVNEEALIPKLSNIDVVIAGGGDELLANPSDTLIPGAGSPVGPYPKPIADRNGRQVPVVTTQGELRYVGRLTIEFTPGGIVRSIDADDSGPVRVSGNVADADVAERDPQLAADVEQPLIDFSAAINSNIIGSSEVALNGGNPDPIRLKESNLGNLVADGYLHAARRAGRPAQVALGNGGGIRSSIAAGPLSLGNTFAVLPFSNFVARVADMPRSQVKELLEHGYGALPNANGKFSHIAGMSVELSTACTAQVTNTNGTIATPGRRVRNVTLDNGTKIVEDGEVVAGDPIDVATLDFLANGGDGYPFRGAAYEVLGRTYQQSLEDYIKDAPGTGGLGATVTAAQYPIGGEGRITISAATPAGGC